MISLRVKRFLFVAGFLCLAVAATAGGFAYLLMRDVPFNWEQINRYEAYFTKSKLRYYDEGVKNHEEGYVRLSQVEINSYLRTFLTNSVSNSVPGAARLEKVGVSLSKTNLALYSWCETTVAGLPAHFVVQRGFTMGRGEAAPWSSPPTFLRVGDLEVPREYWPRLQPILDSLDAPLVEAFSWVTNVKALVVTKNELSQRPEMRLYNYDPFPRAEAH